MRLRSIRLGAPAVVAAMLALAACGGGSSGSEVTPSPNTTPWRTLAPVQNSTSDSRAPLEGGTINYTVRAGDYANGIAKKAGGGCTGQDLLDFNPEVDNLYPGQVIKIPATCLAEGVTEENLNAEPEESDSGDSGDSGSSDSGNSDDSGEPEYNSYTVEKGDYWFGIVKKTGCSYKELKKANPRVSKLYPGKKLKIPADCDERDSNDTDSDSG